MKSTIFFRLLIVLATILVACPPQATRVPASPTSQPELTARPEDLEPMPQSIVDAAFEDNRFTTMIAAVEAAGLVEALQGDGPLTLFAPTDQAFNALPAGTIDALLNDIPAVPNILLYHVVDGRVLAADVVAL